MILNHTYNELGKDDVVYYLFSSANKYMLKVAQYASQLEQYDKAITIYEQVRINREILVNLYQRSL